MINYKDFIKEKIDIKLDGKYGFFMFLKLIDDLKMNFLKTNHYLNIGNYQYFFTTEHIKNKEQFIRNFRDLISIKTTCDTAQKLKDIRLSFYFGIKNNNLEYGFQDDMKKLIYKTGIFEVDTKYIRSIKSYKCLSLIENILKKTDLLKLSLLHEIKNSLKFWYENKGDILILNENIIKKSIDKEDIKDNIKEHDLLLQSYEKWCEKFKWINKVYYYIDNDDENKVTFYIKIK